MPDNQQKAMHELIVQQLKYEIETCKRLLNFITDENVHLKNRLAEMVKASIEINLLSDMETYLSKFVAQDEYINLLKNDVAKIENRLWEQIHGVNEIVNDIYPGLRLLQSNVLKIEELFVILRRDFNNFLCERIINM